MLTVIIVILVIIILTDAFGPGLWLFLALAIFGGIVAILIYDSTKKQRKEDEFLKFYNDLSKEKLEYILKELTVAEALAINYDNYYEKHFTPTDEDRAYVDKYYYDPYDDHIRHVYNQLDSTKFSAYDFHRSVGDIHSTIGIHYHIQAVKELIKKAK